MKKTMFRTFALMLALLLVFSGCVGDPSNGSTEPSTQPKPTEYTLEKIPGYNQITFYWNNTKGKDLATCDVWAWWNGGDGKGYLFYPCEYGAKAIINIPEDVEQVGFIVRTDCSEPGGSAWGSANKDFGEDRFAVITGADTAVYLKTGEGSQYFSYDGGKTLEMIKKLTLAGMTGFDTIRYNLTPAVRITDLKQVKVRQDGKEIPVTNLSSLNNQVVSGIITVGEKLDISKPYTLQIEGYDEMPIVPNEIFDSKEFIDNYTYDGTDLGATINGSNTTFKVWAPTASKVVLNLFTAGNGVEAFAKVDMVKADKGVWEYTQSDCGHGTYYTYTVTTSVGTQEATDPYAKAAGVNGNRSMVVDLSKTNPDNWSKDKTVSTDRYTDAVIWEVHVRDFSNKIASSQYKGKYLAFTERGLKNAAGVSVGVDYLVELGVTHVHLLPVYDYATVDESSPEDEFNWGYDPKNYNVPEGSYSTDPFNGEVRIKEYKQMVQALHDAGIGVIMDMVYNHTYDANSAFNKIVPYYYYRYTPTGANSSASGCGNDTASERKMFGKFMEESTAYWTKEYHLDGLRFDLMGLHDLQTMDNVEKAVHAVNPDAVIYGEGWTMGSTINGSLQANQQNIGKIEPAKGAAGAVAVFNDAIRDGLKGSVFEKTSQGYISGDYRNNQAKVQFGIRGGTGTGATWSVKRGAVINYMSAHDNHTLWDKLALSNAGDSVEARLAMNRLGAGILMISKGTPFWQAGEEMLRTKGGDENSYKSSDAVNNIDWEALVPGSNEYEMMTYYKGLIEMRAAYDVFRSGDETSVSFENLKAGGMVAKFADRNGVKAIVLINPTFAADSYAVSGNWKLVANGTTAGAEVIETANGTLNVAGRSVSVYVK